MCDTKEMFCFQCFEDITPENDGMAIYIGNNEIWYQCCDCHVIEYDEEIYAMNLVFGNENNNVIDILTEDDNK